MAHIERLLDAGLAAEHMGVITPYNGQVALLRELRGERLSAVEISSVDGFQGRNHKVLQMHSVLKLLNNTNLLHAVRSVGPDWPL